MNGTTWLRDLREGRWTESVAVGSKAWAKGRKMNEDEETFELWETDDVYDFEGKNSTLSLKNTYYWDDSV